MIHQHGADVHSFDSDSPRLMPADPALIAQWLGLLVEPGSVVEMRAFGYRPQAGREFTYTHAGFFDADHLGEMAREACAATWNAPGVYLTLNPLIPEILARGGNRCGKAGKNELAGDKHVQRRRWLYIDIDADRLSGISATDEEKAKAHKVAHAVYRFLESLRWPAPVVGDSGNGYALFYRIDLPPEDDGLVRRVLQVLASRFDGGGAKIDRVVFNPARIAKIPGTLSRKGDSTPDRPHRCSALVSVPGCTDPRSIEELAKANLEVVPVLMLEALAAEMPVPPPRRSTTPRPTAEGERSRLMVDRWLTDRGVGFREDDHSDGKSSSSINAHSTVTTRLLIALSSSSRAGRHRSSACTILAAGTTGRRRRRRSASPTPTITTRH